jgi:predicted amidohydrolase
MKLVACQHPGVEGRKAESLEAMARMTEAAAGRGALLVVFPEMFLTGYNIGEAVHDLAEPAGGPSAVRAAAIARQAGVAILYGYPERDGERVFNSALLFDRHGNRLANYRKNHLYGDMEKQLFQPGDGLAMAELDGLKVGILICYDVEFPEAVRALSLAGAELIAVPTALIQPYDIVARTLVPARSFENQVYIAYAGLCGIEAGLGYCGLSCIVGPDGKDLARAGVGAELIFADIDPAAIPKGREANPYLADRRPELYATPLKRLRSPSAK